MTFTASPAHTLSLFTAAPALPSSPEPTVPAWVGARAEEDAATLAALQATRMALGSALSHAACFSTTASRILDGLDAIETIADDLWDAALITMVTAAETAFAHPTGLPLKIPRDAVREHFQRPMVTRARGTAPTSARAPYAAIWQHLEATYNQAEAREAAQRAAIHAFVSTFLQTTWRDTTLKPPVWRSGHLVLELSVFSERRFNGDMQYSYHAEERLRTALDTAAAIFQLMGSLPLADGARAARSFKWGAIDSRARHAFSGGLRLVTYQKKIELEIPPGSAEDLMAFIAPNLGEAGRQH